MFFRFKKSIALALCVAFFAPWFYLTNAPRAEAVVPVVETGGNLFSNIATSIVQNWTQVMWMVIRVGVMIAARLLLAVFTRQIIEWINSGFEGRPAFLNDPVMYFMEVADQVTGAFIHQLGLDGLLCGDWSLHVRFALQQAAYMPQIELYRCTISQVMDNVDAFVNNFSTGGWRGWLAYNEPQHNPYGAFLHASMGLVRHQNTALGHLQQEVAAGDGFLTMRSCVERDELGNCMVYQTETPGSVLVSQVNHVLGSPVRQAELARDLGEAIDAIFTALINQLVTMGLRSLTAPGSEWAGSTAGGITESMRAQLIAQIEASLQREHREWHRGQLEGFLLEAQNATTTDQLQDILMRYTQFIQNNPPETNPNPGAPPIQGDDLPPEDIPTPPPADGFVGDTSMDDPFAPPPGPGPGPGPGDDPSDVTFPPPPGPAPSGPGPI